ncbi:MAG TPA: GAF domain-containing protein [Acidimicrobiales bacterium]|nr:GAF domain-containing protein [Acidimicrobiales bacterium]
MPFSRIERVDTLRRLLEAVLVFETDMTPRALLDHVVSSASELADARFGALAVLDPDGDGLAEFVTVGLDPHEQAAIGADPRGRGLLGLLVTDPQPIRLADLTKHPRFVGFPANHPVMTSFLGVPVRARGRVLGSLYLADKVTGGEFTDEDEAAVVALAAAAGLAIDNARLAVELSLLGVIEERERLARHLHDEVMQRLYATALSLQGTARRIDEDSDVGRRLRGAVVDLDETITRIRSTIFELQSEPVEATGLRARVLALIRGLSATLSFEPEVHFSGDAERTVGDAVADAALEAIEATLNDVAARGGATAAIVALAVGEDLVVEVTARGGGGPIDVGPVQARAGELGGSAEIRTDDAGSGVVWTVPLPGGR